MLFDGLRNIMMGSVGETIKSLLNIANSLSKRNIKNPEVRTMCLVTIGHLCRLLTQSGNSLELLETWENGCFGASFCEEVFLGAVVSANDQLFPVQVNLKILRFTIFLQSLCFSIFCLSTSLVVCALFRW